MSDDSWDKSAKAFNERFAEGERQKEEMSTRDRLLRDRYCAKLDEISAPPLTTTDPRAAVALAKLPHLIPCSYQADFSEPGVYKEKGCNCARDVVLAYVARLESEAKHGTEAQRGAIETAVKIGDRLREERDEAIAARDRVFHAANNNEAQWLGTVMRLEKERNHWHEAASENIVARRKLEQERDELRERCAAAERKLDRAHRFAVRLGYDSWDAENEEEPTDA